MKKECSTCENWKPVQGAMVTPDSFGNCQKIVNGSDIRVSGPKQLKLQTSASFGCKYYSLRPDLAVQVQVKTPTPTVKTQRKK